MKTVPTRSEPCSRGLSTYLDPELFRALGDPNRLQLLARLAAAPGALTVTELSSCCGVHLSGVSRHLKALHAAGVLESEREGREVRYRLDCGALAALLRGLADALEQCRAGCCAAPCKNPEENQP